MTQLDRIEQMLIAILAIITEDEGNEGTDLDGNLMPRDREEGMPL